MNMGTRYTGMIFQYQDDKKKLKEIIYKWMKHETDIIQNETNIYVEFLDKNIVFIQNSDIFYSAYNDPELWEELVLDLPIRDWVIFFECVDNCESYSYIIYHNGVEIRKIYQNEEEPFEQHGEIQGFEKLWLDYSVYFEREYFENGEAKTEYITDPEFSLEDIIEDDNETYYMYYRITANNETFYHTNLVRILLSKLLKHYIGINLIDDSFQVKEQFKIDYLKIPKYEKLLKQAKASHIPAQIELGNMFRDGYGVKKDEPQALQYYQQVAEQENDEGQFLLGLCYLNGIGTPIDSIKALFWIEKSSAQGNVNATTQLGIMYETGNGIEQNFAEAIKLYRKAGKQKDTLAPYRLGLLYEHGLGDEVDLAIAKRWYYQAAAYCNTNAQARLDALKNN